MSALTPSRDALAKAMHEAMCCSDPEKIAVDGFLEAADDLLATGAVIDAATLADDADFVSLVAHTIYDHAVNPTGVKAVAILRALAAALTDRGQS